MEGVEMKKIIKYETPEIEITRFELGVNIMDGIGIGIDDNENGNGDEQIRIGSEVAPTVPDIEFPAW